MAAVAKAHSCRSVAGPISALLLTLRRIGRDLPDVDMVVDHPGRHFDAVRHSSTFFGELVEQGAKRSAGMQEVERQGRHMWPWQLPPAWRPLNEAL